MVLGQTRVPDPVIVVRKKAMRVLEAGVLLEDAFQPIDCLLAPIADHDFRDATCQAKVLRVFRVLLDQLLKSIDIFLDVFQFDLLLLRFFFFPHALKAQVKVVICLTGLRV